MQQVGAKYFVADARPVDPRLLPVPLRRPGARPLMAARHLWVLHRKALLRSACAAVVLACALGLYEAREPIAGLVSATTGNLQGELAGAGFAIEEIGISGQSLTREADIVNALAMQPRMTTFTFDADAARARLEALPSVAAATVRKVYPGGVVVTVAEKAPVARWRVGDDTWLVDAEGSPIAVDDGGWPELPLVVGEGAADDAIPMIKALDRFSGIRKDLAALSRIGDRRWDLIYYTGLRVQLPEVGVALALTQLETYQQRYALLDRDVSVIDLRVGGLVSYKPILREEADEDAQ